MFDPYLVPAYLQLRQAETGTGAGQHQNGHQRSDPTQEGPPAKRRRGAPHAEPSQQHRGRRQQQEQALPCEIDQGQNGEQDEVAEWQAAAKEHLQELSTGFSKGGLLAPWLRQLLRQLRPGTGDDQAAQQKQQQQEQQSLDSRVWQLAQEWTELSAWQPRVSAACAAAGLPPPRRRHEWLPLATGTCVVFEASSCLRHGCQV